ncbi:MAG: arginine--tRNA ligase [Candidatus Omnitrophica bacterium CG11_big_fil_rev_8_21_14_0_20_42_13]|uniref:Arginine--tRNA ligase n=1 Tax=Candidatus Ghiorseimicrobium undicola TaxID=1974746 RepID=A0A2H0LWV2_9BACT|nr:MAG: arginine--tRNA ligase [Candidatus Omnitrophica bacterium CG11_big_fil_rev_8_21_14_0_20_42_13]
MRFNLEEEIVLCLRHAASREVPSGAESILGEIYLDIPQIPAHGDLSSNLALRLSKAFKKNPRVIAESMKKAIEEEIKSLRIFPVIEKIQIDGPGFINFFIKNSYFYSEISEIIKKGNNYGKLDIGKGEKVQIEFVSANPTGPLSIAHARQAAVGDSLSRIMEFLGFKIAKEYYLNDEGNQINILGRSIELRMRELCDEQVEFPEDCYQGDYVKEIAEEIKNQKSKIKNISEYGVNSILKGIKKDLQDFNVEFDIWYSQGELEKSGKIEKAIEYLKKKGFIYEKDGAAWFKSSEFSDDKDRVIIKSDKSYTYLAPDIAYHRDKYQRGFKKIINIWGPDHHGYIPRIKAAVSALGHDSKSLSILIAQLVTLYRDGELIPMSTRKGSYVTLRQVIDEVGKDAARFFLVNRRLSSHLDFDLELAKKHSSENPVYYIQYAFARICSIMQKKDKNYASKTCSLSLLDKPEELFLMRKLVQFPHILKAAVAVLDPYPLVPYLLDLSAEFHKFYDKYKVLDEENLELSRARIDLINACKIVFKNGLSLLGLSAPEKM